MKTRLLCAFLSASLLLAASRPAAAVWRFTRVDHSLGPHVRMEGGQIAYQKNHDVVRYEVAANRKTAVTANAALAEESPLALQGGQIWYVSSFPVPTPKYRLFRFQSDTGQHELLYTSDREISAGQSAWDGLRLVVRIHGDWWLWDGAGMRQLTFTGTAVRKEAPCLQGDHLLWVGDGRVFHTLLSSGETRAVTTGQVQKLSLRASGTHAAWVEAPPPGETGYLIRLMPLRSLQPITVDTSARVTWSQVRFEPPDLFYVRKSGDVWSVVRMDPLTRTPQPLYSSGLPLDDPSLHRSDLFFTVMNCVDVECLELYKHDLMSLETERLTSYGQGSFIGGYVVAGERLAFLRLNLFNPDEPLELFAGMEEPGALCGTSQACGPGHVPLNLLLLLLPLTAAWWWARAGRQGKPPPDSVQPRSSGRRARPGRLGLEMDLLGNRPWYDASEVSPPETGTTLEEGGTHGREHAQEQAGTLAPHRRGEEPAGTPSGKRRERHPGEPQAAGDRIRVRGTKGGLVGARGLERFP